MNSTELEALTKLNEMDAHNDLYGSYRQLKRKSKCTKTTDKIKILLDYFEDCDDTEADEKHKCLHDLRYFIDRLERDM